MASASASSIWRCSRGSKLLPIALGHHLGDLALFDQHFFPFGFAGMGGHHQPHAHLTEERAHLIRREAAVTQGAHRRTNQLVKVVVPLTLAQDTNPLLILGNVDQLEKVAESFDQNALLFQVRSFTIFDRTSAAF